MQKLSMLTKARTLDGGYYTARQLPILKESGIWTIDALCIRRPKSVPFYRGKGYLCDSPFEFTRFD